MNPAARTAGPFCSELRNACWYWETAANPAKDMGVSASGEKSLLLVEDNPGDVRLTLEAFRGANRDIHLHVVSDGAEAHAFLKRRGGHVCAPRPDLILLDLNMPKMDGHGLLRLIKEDETLKSIPTVVLTMSSAGEDIARSYELKANCFLTKPVEFELFETMVRTINEFWLTRASLPQQTLDRFGVPISDEYRVGQGDLWPPDR